MRNDFFQYPMQRPSRSGPYLLPSNQYAYFCKLNNGWYAAADTPAAAVDNFKADRKAYYSEWKGVSK